MQKIALDKLDESGKAFLAGFIKRCEARKVDFNQFIEVYATEQDALASEEQKG